MSGAVAIGFYSVAAFGFAYVVGHAQVSLGARAWIAERGPVGEWLVLLAECPACTGWWAGLFASLLGVPAEWLPGLPGWLRWALWAFGLECYTAGFNFFAGRVTGLIADPNAEETDAAP